jgi:hypothetical protein
MDSPPTSDQPPNPNLNHNPDRDGDGGRNQIICVGAVYIDTILSYVFFST